MRVAMSSTRAPLAQRVASLSDSVFGVGMTLLAYEINFPKDATVHDTLAAVAPQVHGLALSFAVAVMYWMSQQRRLTLRQGEPSAFVVMELVLVFAVILLPISTRSFVISKQSHGDAQGAAVILYSGNLAALACINAVLWLLTPHSGVSPHARNDRDYKVVSSLVAFVFLASFALSFSFPGFVQRLWWAAFLAPFARLAWGRWRGSPAIKDPAASNPELSRSSR
jgi:uncharacterized membrane protein